MMCVLKQSRQCKEIDLQEVGVLDHLMAMQHRQELVAELLLLLRSLLIHSFQLFGMACWVQYVVAVGRGSQQSTFQVLQLVCGL